MNNEINKVLFIINRKSGNGYQPEVEGRILDVCRKQDAECTIEFTKGRGHATELAKQGAEKNFDLVVAVGGDGTMNEVAQGLVHTAVPMGIIPNGSGNGFARHLGIPVHIRKAANMLFKSTPLKIDTFTVNNKRSLNVSGIGFDGYIAGRFDTAGKRGFASYARITFDEYLRYSEFDAAVSVNGEDLTRRAFIIAIANSSQYGNNARIAPRASVRDHKLNVCFVRKAPLYRADVALALFSGYAHRLKFCETLEADALTVILPHPVSYHIDGEPGGEARHFDIRLYPASLTVMVPEGKEGAI